MLSNKPNCVPGMLIQIYEISTPEEARSICAIGVDHIGILVGIGEFSRELPLKTAATIAGVARAPAKLSALILTADISLSEKWVPKLRPTTDQLGAAPEPV